MSEKELEGVYEDRNVLAVHFVKSQLAPSNPLYGGWMPAPDTNNEEQEWAIIWIETLVGEVSWHVPRHLAQKHLPRNEDRDYNGYSREAKNDRLWNLVDDLGDFTDQYEEVSSEQ